MLRVVLGFVTLLLINSVSYALNVYEQADDKTKIVFTAKPGEQLIPIFTKENWLKVANPQDGEVGWVRLSDLKKSFKPNDQQNLTDKNEQPKLYRVIEYSGPEKLKPEQLEQMLAQMQKRQEQMNRYMQIMMQNMFQNFQAMQSLDPLAWHQEMLNGPVMVVPEELAKNTKSSAIEKAETSDKEKSSLISKIKEKINLS